ncbi:M48 family metalloprotease [Candidatus Saccharibacteria bacterium]|nr:M48 family metalloprotease [Candidatus Saccharibacteria bacterium]
MLAIAGAIGCAFLLLAVWRTQRLWKVYRISATSHPPKLQLVCRKLEISLDQVICSAEPDAIAFCMGWLQPYIVISTGLIEQVSVRELSAILAHEQWHRQHRDPLRLLLMQLLQTVLYPLPMIHELYRAFLTQIEIEADAAAVEYSGRPALASALYKMLTLPTPPASTTYSAVVTSFSPQANRLAHLLNPQLSQPIAFSTVCLVLSLLPFFLLCFTMFIT